ncbi:hypothetical protein FGIG_09893 [Fasciola gigantica]|uniref:CUB domain-containing protein n=1 Tax=Fasciola gigantica TaxID=46835 RepID=A0A504Z4R2_FASGI|nr:hypothetical protein FGIG_09893 [Fasciola gigantica]
MVNTSILPVTFTLSSTIVCDTTQLTARENELYYDVCPQPGPIPANFKCNRTVVANSGRSIQVYLKVFQTSGKDQCVQLIDAFNSSRITEVICAQSGQELYQSVGSSVSVMYPGKQMNTQVNSFQIYYMLMPIVDCNTTQLTALLVEQYYEVYAQRRKVSTDFECERAILVTEGQKMQVYLKVSNASSADQCVQVTDQIYPYQISRVICAQSGQELYQSIGSVVTVTYPGKRTSGRITSFQVFYLLICDTTQLTARENELYYDVCPQPGPIPANFQCNRTIVADPGRSILIYLKVLETSGKDQCVQLIDAFNSSRITEVICAQSGQELYQSVGSSASVMYPGKQMNTQVNSFQIYYMLMPIINCNTTQLTAVFDEQYYEVYARRRNIPNNFECKRTISVTEGQKMKVYLKVFQAFNADQCVQVTDPLDSSQTDHVICAQSGQELYQSIGSVVTVTYPGKRTSGRITSFQVFYLLICDTTQLTARENELYYDVCPQPGPIPANFKCNSTIVADPGRSIQVYLKVLETSTTDQCVQLIDVFDSSRITEVICAQSGQELYQSTGSSVSVMYPGKQLNTQVNSFQVYYTLSELFLFDYVSDDEGIN